MAYGIQKLKAYFFPAGLIVGLLTWAVASLWKLIPATTVQFATVDVRSKLVGGLGTAVGDKIFGLIGGIAVPNIFVLLFSGMIITAVGAFILSTPIPSVFGKGQAGQWASILLYGSFATTTVLALISGAGFSFNLIALITLAAYSLIIGFVISQVYKNKLLGLETPSLPK